VASCASSSTQQGLVHEVSARWKQQRMKRSGELVAVTQQAPGYVGASRASLGNVRGSNLKLALPVIEEEPLQRRNDQEMEKKQKEGDNEDQRKHQGLEDGGGERHPSYGRLPPGLVHVSPDASQQLGWPVQ
jgi:hypothetical protein